MPTNSNYYKRHMKLQTVKQIMPLPAGMTVMMAFCDDDDEQHWIDCRETPYPVGLALVETAGRDEVLPYDFSDSDVMDDNAIVVNLMNCPCCGEPMQPHLLGSSASDAYHTCKCGCTLEWFGSWQDVSGKTQMAEMEDNNDKK